MIKVPFSVPCLDEELWNKKKYLEEKEWHRKMDIVRFIDKLNEQINDSMAKAIRYEEKFVEITIPDEEIKDFIEFYVPYLENSGFEYKILEKKGWFWGRWLVVRLNLE